MQCMKSKISSVVLGMSALLAISSCTKKDNYDGPDASLQGNVFIEGTSKGSKIQTCTGNFSIRLEQLSWSETPTPQNIPIKIDGSYKNSKLFSGHYRITLFGGAIWPVAPEEIDIGENSTYDFEVMPYMFINNFTTELNGTSLKLKFDLDVPILGVPKITEIQPFVNTTSIVGPGASIREFSEGKANEYRVVVNKEWSEFTESDKSREITINNLIPGRTFFVRVGVRFDDSQKNYNLSEVIKIIVPG